MYLAAGTSLLLIIREFGHLPDRRRSTVFVEFDNFGSLTSTRTLLQTHYQDGCSLHETNERLLPSPDIRISIMWLAAIQDNLGFKQVPVVDPAHLKELHSHKRDDRMNESKKKHICYIHDMVKLSRSLYGGPNEWNAWTSQLG